MLTIVVAGLTPFDELMIDTLVRFDKNDEFWMWIVLKWMLRTLMSRIAVADCYYLSPFAKGTMLTATTTTSRHSQMVVVVLDGNCCCCYGWRYGVTAVMMTKMMIVGGDYYCCYCYAFGEIVVPSVLDIDHNRRIVPTFSIPSIHSWSDSVGVSICSYVFR
jgi:hypothetical protein